MTESCRIEEEGAIPPIWQVHGSKCLFVGASTTTRVLCSATLKTSLEVDRTNDT